MSEKGSILAEQLEWAVGSLVRACGELGAEEYKWEPTAVSTSVQWQLNHISRIINVALPRLIKGVTEYTPEGWAEDYRDQDYPLDKLMADIQKGKEVSIKKLKKLSNEAMDEEIPLWGGTKLRKEGLFAYIGEVYHHKGQVTYIRGTYKRLNE
jgi:uncharacterized damage-inducible protein DinB